MLFTEDESLSNYWHWTVETEQLALSDTNILLYCPLIEITTTTISLSFNIKSVRQSGALSLVGRVEIVLSLVESFIELKYFHDVILLRQLSYR